MDTSHENMAEKRKIAEAQEGDLRVVKMDEDDHAESKTTPGPTRKKFKKQKKDVDKSPLMLFNELLPSAVFTLESSSGPSHQPEFIMSVVVEGKYWAKGSRLLRPAFSGLFIDVGGDGIIYV